MTEVTERPEYGSHESSSKLKHPRDVEAGEYGSDKSESSKRPRLAPWFDLKPDTTVDEKDHCQRCKDALRDYRELKVLDYEYELLELVKYGIVPMMAPQRRWHYNFKAKKKAVNRGRARGGLVGALNSDSDSSPAPAPNFSSTDSLSISLRNVGSAFHFQSLRAAADDDSPKLFYADVCETYRDKYRFVSVMQCEILDPSDSVENCQHCKNDVLHPTNLVGPDAVPFWIAVDLIPNYY